jgi:hypothetical protein
MIIIARDNRDGRIPQDLVDALDFPASATSLFCVLVVDHFGPPGCAILVPFEYENLGLLLATECLPADQRGPHTGDKGLGGL